MEQDYNSENYVKDLDGFYKQKLEPPQLIKSIQDLELTQPEKKIRGKFNKDLLLNSFFEHTELFSPAANTFLKEGKYCGEVFNSKKYNIFWGEERERCLYGYENPKTKIWIPGKYYWHLNYAQLSIVHPDDIKAFQEGTKKKVRRIQTFPRFWPIHYFFIQDYNTASENGLNIVVLKPRDTGFSELFASIASHEYTFQTVNPVFFFVSTERYLNKDGVLSKCWDRLNFLNSKTERAFKHLRQYKDQDLYKKASFFDYESNSEVETGGEIQGAVVDHPRKLRGARGYVNFEEAGSFPDLLSSWMTAVDLAQQGGLAFAMMCAYGTGGEQGPGIMGLEELFTNPSTYDCLPFDNCWEEGNTSVQDHGFFFPSWACMSMFMDKWGNTNFVKAKEYRDKEREKLAKRGESIVDKKRAEQPYTYTEALSRLTFNPFPINELQRQLRKVDSSPDIQGILKHGDLEIVNGEIQFVLNSKLDPVNKYPHKTDAVLEGAFTMFEPPLRDNNKKVPDNLYYIVADCFAVDTEQATDWNSLGTYYVYKRTNTLFPTEDDILVAWYAGRPPRVKDFHRRVFYAARYYNAIVQTEIKGGGNELLNYAKEHSMLHLCGERPSVFNQDKEFKKVSGRQFFIRVEESNKPELLQKLADWLRKERGGKIENDKAQYVLNLERIYDRALLEELIKFNYTGNFDRISCLLVLMCIIQEAELQAITQLMQPNRDHIFNRGLFRDEKSNQEYQLSFAEMTAGERQTYQKEDPTDLIM